MLVEHRTNAAEQGEHAAKSLLAGDRPARRLCPRPYVWSDQYDWKIQMIGMPPAGRRGRRGGRVVGGARVSWSLFGRGGRLTAALGFGRSRALMAYRPLLERGASFAEALALTPS